MHLEIITLAMRFAYVSRALFWSYGIVGVCLQPHIKFHNVDFQVCDAKCLRAGSVTCTLTTKDSSFKVLWQQEYSTEVAVTGKLGASVTVPGFKS